MSGTDHTTRIILIRHGHVEGILPERFRGRRDVDLSDLGVRQAQATAQRIAGQWTPAVAYTSPLKRCVQTAAAIAAACKSSWTALEDLNDVHYGDWEWHMAALDGSSLVLRHAELLQPDHGNSRAGPWCEIQCQLFHTSRRSALDGRLPLALQ